MATSLLLPECQRYQPRMDFSISIPHNTEFTAPAASKNVSLPFFENALQIISNSEAITSTLPKLALRVSLGVAMGFVCFPANVAITMGVAQYVARFLATNMTGYYACIVAPILEEVVFRDMVQPATKSVVNFFASPFFAKETAKKIAIVTALIFTSLFFGVAHFMNNPNPLVSLPQVVMATVMGVVLGLEKEFSGDILLPWAHHTTNNTIAWTLMQTAKAAARV